MLTRSPRLQGVPEVAGLPGAAGRGGPGAEVDDDAVLGAASEIGHGGLGAGWVGKGEVGASSPMASWGHGVLLCWCDGR